MKTLALLFACIFTTAVFGQIKIYTPSNAHSHNNYAQPNIFWEAYNLQYGSIEADVFLSADSTNLWVAHTSNEVKTTKRSLDTLYLQPLISCIQKNGGYVYADHSKKLQLMIDVKTEAVSTLNELIKMINKYPVLMHTSSLKFVISGNRPNEMTFKNYPRFIWFDGEMAKNYTKPALQKIAMMSGPLTKFTKWSDTVLITEAEDKKITQIIQQVHALKKPIRFWDTPDNAQAWKILMLWKVDFINTDHVVELANYFKTTASSK